MITGLGVAVTFLGLSPVVRIAASAMRRSLLTLVVDYSQKPCTIVESVE